MRWLGITALLAVVACTGGCRAVVLQKDQDRFRQVLLDSYTEQIMDNLIRAANALPIVQVDYTTITGTVSDTGSGSLAGSQTTTDNTALAFGSTLKNLTSRTASRAFENLAGPWSASAMRNQQLSVTGNPVTDKPGVYRAYLDFLNKPGSLMRTCDPPPPGAAHLCRQRGDAYFWVPVQYRKDFFELSLKTTVMRSEPVVAPTAFAAKVNEAVVDQPVPGQPKTDHILTVTLDHPIPNDSGTLKFSIGGAPYVVRLSKVPGQPDETATFSVGYVQSNEGIPLPPNDVVAGLKAAGDVQITLLHHQPEVPKTEAILQNIFNQVQLNRLDNLRLINRAGAP